MTRRQLVDGRAPSGTAALDPLWTRLREIISFINGSRILHGRLLTEEPGAVEGSGLAFSAGVARTIPHGLGRRAIGFLEVCGPDLSASGGCGLTATDHPPGCTSDHYVTIFPDATGRTFVWVF